MNPFSECGQWKRIVTALSEKAGFDIFKEPFRFRIASLRAQAYRGKEHPVECYLRKTYSRAIRNSLVFWIAQPIRVLARPSIVNNWRLFDTIGNTLGSNWVVDSSKFIDRMHLLYSNRPADVRVILLIRNIKGVAASAEKRGFDPIAEANHWYRYYRAACKTLRLCRTLRCMAVRYETLCAEPVATRKRIASFLDLNNPGDDLSIDTHEHHLVAGNPMRYRGKIEIRYNDEWKQVLKTHTADKVDLIGARADAFFKDFEIR
jgi:hypothetical protein